MLAVKELEAFITARTNAELVEIQDDTAKHAGHKTARAGSGHYTALIVSPLFQGLTLLARHRLIYGILKEKMGAEIHAFAMKTLTPEEWKRKPNN
jgi:BolA family transcriptional regulator, general stress-responsive regulator